MSRYPINFVAVKLSRNKKLDNIKAVTGSSVEGILA
jgi:hypothetical protein